MSKPSDYENAKKITSELPKIYLGQEISTPLGLGLVINIKMPSNGLYLSPEKAECLVWFGTDNSKSGWVQYSYSLKELEGYL